MEDFHVCYVDHLQGPTSSAHKTDFLLQEYVVKSRECLQHADPALGADCPHLQKLKVLFWQSGKI